MNVASLIDIHPMIKISTHTNMILFRLGGTGFFI